MEKEKDGVWRTIRGRRIFIGKGESLGEAMSKSGKFKREDIRKGKGEARLQDSWHKLSPNKKQTKGTKRSFEKNIRKSLEPTREDYYNQDEKNRINENAHIEGSGQTRVQRNWNKYSEADRREHRHELIQKKLADYKEKTASPIPDLNLKIYEHVKNNIRAEKERKYQDKQKEKSRKAIEDFKAKKQSNNKINDDVKKFTEDYKKARKEYKEKYDDLTEDEKIKKALIEDRALEQWGATDKARKQIEKELKEAGIGKQSNNKVELSKKQIEAGNRLNEKAENNARDDIKQWLGNNDKTPYDDLINNVSNEWNIDKKRTKELYNEEKNKYDNNIEDSNTYKFGNQKYNTRIEKNFDNYGRADRDEAINNEVEKAVKEIKKETSFDNQFSQNIDMTGDVRLYSPNEIKRMENAGVKPMEHSYTGGGWEGVNSNLHLDTKDQAKRITDAVKKKYPDVKVARKTNLFSGGSSIDFNIMSSDKDLFVSDKDIDKMEYSDLQDVSRSNGFEWWAKDNIKDYDNHKSFNIDDVRKYAKESLAQRKQSDIQGVRGSEWYLSDYGKKVVSDLNKEANSYTYDDSDGMVDYFDHGTYMHISIGKWNKPYQVNESKKIKDYVSKKKSNHK